MKAEVDIVNGVYYLYFGDGPTPEHIIAFDSFEELNKTLIELHQLLINLEQLQPCFP